jgi:hypothetical protein
LEGKVQPLNPEDRIVMAEILGFFEHRYLAAVAFYAEAFGAAYRWQPIGPKERLNAARAAILAVTGQGVGSERLAPEEAYWLSHQARSWLRAGVAAHQNLVTKGRRRLSPETAEQLRKWLQNEDLAAVRTQEMLAAFPADERKEWSKFWVEVEALLKEVPAPSKE